MSLDYFSRTGWRFNVNSCGADLLGHVHRLAGAAMSANREQAIMPRVPYVTSNAECCASSAKIAALQDTQIIALLDQPAVRECFNDTPADFVAFVRSWQKYLLCCGGYDTDPSWLPDNGAEWKAWRNE